MGELFPERYCCYKWKLKLLTIFVAGDWILTVVTVLS